MLRVITEVWEQVKALSSPIAWVVWGVTTALMVGHVAGLVVLPKEDLMTVWIMGVAAGTYAGRTT